MSNVVASVRSVCGANCQCGGAPMRPADWITCQCGKAPIFKRRAGGRAKEGHAGCNTAETKIRLTLTKRSVGT